MSASQRLTQSLKYHLSLMLPEKRNICFAFSPGFPANQPFFKRITVSYTIMSRNKA